MDLQAKITAAAEYILNTVPNRPTIGMVLGSGLGDFADTLENPVRIAYSDIPNFPLPTVAGHAGALVFGEKMGQSVVVCRAVSTSMKVCPCRKSLCPLVFWRRWVLRLWC